MWQHVCNKVVNMFPNHPNQPNTMVSHGLCIVCEVNAQNFAFLMVRNMTGSQLKKIWKQHQLAAARPSCAPYVCFSRPFVLLFWHCCQSPSKSTSAFNISEESGCAAKNSFQEVPYSQRGEEVVLNRPEVAYKRLLEACGRMPYKSN